ncbi:MULTISPECIES: PspC domain-containing protein [Listeria]|uniref:PspC domain-containing protein n=1 Tax=Listeria TaxID=1637 RepID=UPI00162446EF|nr:MULTISPECIES: PspC domain-containing protein [Listeria]MBC1569618.1 PspC domain-containing protein [Listeria cossartiae subsp. cossartiae]MBC1572255.1 PspC domain-containing protein [Listeria cossartiae subsp. cossartiae]MBC1807378.1 PspC domain-containing protein [Listeria cossartiae subsp. cayugensis]MBC1987975.1 PspC domain-containing protein [Listeria cossartiae subsp. cossartiae]MBC2187034.1 PspC domain-containing protein [Listeria cossartiae subsp. cossartiae]
MKKLYKSSSQKMISGVCGGLAEYFNIEVTLVRLLWVVASLFLGSGILLYIIAAIIIPKRTPESEWE